MVGSIIRTIFAQPDKQHVNAQFDEVTKMLERSHPKVATMLTTPGRTCSRSQASRRSIGVRSGPRTRWNG